MPATFRAVSALQYRRKLIILVAVKAPSRLTEDWFSGTFEILGIPFQLANIKFVGCPNEMQLNEPTFCEGSYYFENKNIAAGTLWAELVDAVNGATPETDETFEAKITKALEEKAKLDSSVNANLLGTGKLKITLKPPPASVPDDEAEVVVTSVSD